MKKILYISVFAVAAMSALSCEKAETPEMDGLYVIRFDAPVISVDDADDTKVCIKDYAANGRPNYAWQSGDAIHIYSYDIPETWADATLTDWGKFTTEDNNKTSAKFKGVLPATAVNDYYFSFFSNCDSEPQLVKHATRGRYDIKTNIPAVQDGTGIPYCFFAARPASFDSGTGVFSFAAINNISTGNTSQSQYNCQYALRCNLTKFNIPVFATAAKKIKRIDITLSYAKGATQYLASSGSNRDISLSSLNFYPGGGGSTTVSIYKDDEPLPGELLFACRGTEGNGTRGYAILTFVFTNVSNETATAVVKLGAGLKDDGTATTYKNISPYGRMTYIGDFSSVLNESSFN